MRTVPLGEVVLAAGSRARGSEPLPVYSVTKHSGFVPSLEYFKKRVFSRDTAGYKIVEPGHFAYATIHLDEGSIGIAPERCLISPMYTVFSADIQRVDPKYLIRFLKSPEALTRYSQLGRGAIHRRKAISLAALGNLPVPLPTVEEQRRLAAILDKADAIRAKRRQVLAHLDALTQSIFHDMFGAPAAWPHTWLMGSIGDMVESTQYGTSAKAGDSGVWPIVRMGNVTDDGRLDLADLKYIDLSEGEVEKYTVRRGDLLFNRTNSREKVGKACVVDTDQPLALAGYLVRVRLKEEHQPQFVSAYLSSPHGRAIRRKMAKTAVNQANINAREMQSMPIALPPAHLQRRYAERHLAIRAEARRISALPLDDLFVTLQSKAFKGEL